MLTAYLGFSSEEAGELMGPIAFFENFVTIMVLLFAWVVVLIAFFISEYSQQTPGLGVSFSEKLMNFIFWPTVLGQIALSVAADRISAAVQAPSAGSIAIAAAVIVVVLGAMLLLRRLLARADAT